MDIQYHRTEQREIGAILPDGTLLLKALEPAVIHISSLDAQAAFRLAQSRLQLGVDRQPHHDGVWRLSQCVLAEVETLALMSSTPTPPTTNIKVKQLEATSKPGVPTGPKSDKGKGSSTSMSTTPCRYFRSDAGCKAGRNCKWSHSWDGIDDKAARCWICGGKDHRKTECKLKSQTKKDGKGNGEPVPGSGGGNAAATQYRTAAANNANNGAQGASTGAGGGGSSQATSVVKLQEMELGPTNQGSSAGGDVPAVEAASKGGETGATSSEALLQEATQLLKSLRAPLLRVIKVSQLEHDPSGALVLLDSGATHALRPALRWEEWHQATPTQVSLADGVTTKLRLKPDTKVLLSAPDDRDSGQSWIVPLGGIAELGIQVRMERLSMQPS